MMACNMCVTLTHFCQRCFEDQGGFVSVVAQNYFYLVIQKCEKRLNVSKADTVSKFWSTVLLSHAMCPRHFGKIVILDLPLKETGCHVRKSSRRLTECF